MAKDLKDTLHLPKTEFPMRASLPQREPARIDHWHKIDLYAAIQKKTAASDKTYILHDGPPFTNGDVHIGTALNKTLKDITLRYKTMRGYRTPYIPGWDCHGLPIEQKVTRELQAANQQVSTAELREKCDAFSEIWIAKQTASFKRIGILADWANEYKTKAPAYEAEIIRTFAAFVENNLVYRSKKPVYWSIPFETALAEAEIEYKDHVSPSVWVKFPVPAAEAQKFKLPVDKPLSVVIWTTTPWTLPANLAIAVHPEIDYTVADLGTEYILVADQLLQATLDAAKLPSAATPETTTSTSPSPKSLIQNSKFKGAALEKLAARHPFIDRPSPIVLADYVTTESGTGCVHTAPGHGSEDYLTGLKYNLEIYCPVADNGTYIDDGKVPADLVGLTTLETPEDLAAKKTSPANIAVLKKLAATNTLLAKAKITHSYPHCWRSKTPIIFRAVDQWFVSLDKAGHRTKALDSIRNVKWIPAWGEARIRGAVESRPDWCISRQRSWGVPIVAFYDENKTPYLDANVARQIADKISTRGTNYWYDTPAAEILSGIQLPADWPAPEKLTQGRDTLDVWIDSGSSHAATINNYPADLRDAARQPADLYLEGSDQHRGWFQSSLWCSIIAQNTAPYKAVLTHGFIVGEDGKKISKSGQYEKPPTSDNFIAKYGADVIRLWIASQDFTQDITLSEKILNNASEQYRLIRNTLRYQLSNLFDYDPAQHAVPLEKLDTLDRWALHQTAKLLADTTAAYDATEYHRVIQAVTHYCSNTLSAIYHDIIKDRLYTHAADAPQRRSTQTALHHILHTLLKILAPIITFTTDEAWSYASEKKEYTDNPIQLQDWPAPSADWANPGIETDLARLLKIRTQVTEAIEPHRAAGKIGKSLDAHVKIEATGDSLALLQKHQTLLPELFIVSTVEISPRANAGASLDDGATVQNDLTITITHCETHNRHRCPRCWRWVPQLVKTHDYNTCPRCAEALR